jgi:hypothetical protein
VPVPGDVVSDENVALIEIADEGQPARFFLQKFLAVICQDQSVFLISNHFNPCLFFKKTV